jgi:hypothetical protein
MMQTLFGLGSREYTRLRRLLTVDPSVGRPAEPDEASSNRLWGVWVQRVGDQREGPLSPHEYLAIHRETGISMRGIWNLTQRWNQYGDLSGQRNTRASERACSDG